MFNIKNDDFVPTTGHLIWPLELYGHTCRLCRKNKDKYGFEPTYKYKKDMVHLLCYVSLKQENK